MCRKRRHFDSLLATADCSTRNGRLQVQTERSGLPLAKQASSDLKVHGMDSALTNAFCSRLRDVMPGPQD